MRRSFLAKEVSVKTSNRCNKVPGYAENLLNQMMPSRNPNSEKNQKNRKTAVHAVQKSIHTDRNNNNYGMFKTEL